MRSCLFLGVGVGKTEAFDYPPNGFPPGYVGNEENGYLTEAMVID